MIARGQDSLLRRPFRMSVRIFSWVTLVVIKVGAGRVERLPARSRFGKMSDDGPIMCSNILIDGPEYWIIWHQVRANFLPDLHADGFIDFYSYGALLEIFIQLPDDAIGKSRVFEIVGVECCADRSMAWGTPNHALH